MLIVHLHPSDEHYDSHIPALSLHFPLKDMKRNMELFYHSVPCETRLLWLSLQWQSPGGNLEDLNSVFIQFTSGWDGALAKGCRNLQGACVHLPTGPMLLTNHTYRERGPLPTPQRCWVTSVRHNSWAFISSGSRQSALIDSALKWYSS